MWQNRSATREKKENLQFKFESSPQKTLPQMFSPYGRILGKGKFNLLRHKIFIFPIIITNNIIKLEQEKHKQFQLARLFHVNRVRSGWFLQPLMALFVVNYGGWESMCL